MARIEPDQRRRIQLIGGVSLALLLIVAGLVVALRSDDDPKTLNTSNQSTTTTNDDGTIDPIVVTSPTLAPITPTTRGTRATTTTTNDAKSDEPERHCAQTAQSSAEPVPDDWATYWTTQPKPNKPIMLVICVDDITPAVGQEVTLTVTADDPDAKIGDGNCDIYVTWDNNTGSLCRDVVVADDHPNPTPEPEPGHQVKTYTHTYTQTSDPSVEVSVWSGPDDGHRYPYNSYASIELRLSVHSR